ncbi:MAG TPA: CocE/NonD family hydrolase [Myxococcaceae bacterium]|nr:CocE/NonD family hydrolase [Myxococcaceae bacterium]
MLLNFQVKPKGSGRRSGSKVLGIAALCLAVAASATAQEFPLPPAAAETDAELARSMPQLATRVLADYRQADRESYLDNLFRLQMVAGRYGDAVETITTLRRLRSPKIPDGGAWIDVQYEVLARAKLKQTTKPFAEAYLETFRDVIGRLDDRTSALVVRAISAADVGSFDAALKADRDELKGKGTLPLPAALKLIRDYQVADSYRAFAPEAAFSIEEDDRRRYVASAPTAVKLSNGATICALIWRPRAASRLPALLTFTIYAGGRWPPVLARVAASRGYASVVAFTRGKVCSPGQASPYRFDGEDAAALIEWISAQPWSDGRVGMYGGSYSGFTAWAAAKHMPKALKAIAVGASVAPGIDVPMEGNVFWNFLYPWPFYTTDNKELDDAIYGDGARWRRLNHDWYVSGRAYRELDKIDGKPNPIFNDWISHPSYDNYWQRVIPFEREFARINIPVLQTAGYYYGGPGAAVYYFTEHYKHAPKGEHYLLIGPYDHFGAQVGVVRLLGGIHATLAGMNLDPVALIDIEDVRFQFFDYALKKAPKPELLKDKVNYQVTGANLWKHAPSFERMANGRLRLHLDSTISGKSYQLSEQPLSADSFVAHVVNMADRSDADRKAPGGGVVDKEVDAWNGLQFVSDLLPAATELSGLFSGRLDFTANKKDFDFEIDLYELTARGDYVQLAPYWSRASYVGHPGRRRLLTPGKREHLDIQSIRLMGRRLEAGSRIALVLRVVKSPERQINYGSGKDVSDETIADAKTPLEIKWYGNSYVELPVWR